MKKIYKFRTNAYDGFMTAINGQVQYYTTADFVYDINIRDVHDDSSWENDCRGMNVSDFIGDAEIIDVADLAWE